MTPPLLHAAAKGILEASRALGVSQEREGQAFLTAIGEMHLSLPSWSYLQSSSLII